jgi:hypothetical protein
MRKRKIAVVGKGTAGSQAVSHYVRHASDMEIVWYFDPSKPTQSVGEGSTIQLSKSLFTNLAFNHEDLLNVNGTFKTGIYKENWGSSGEPFFHHFLGGGVGYHFSAVELQDYIHKAVSKKVKIVEQEIDYKNIDADFILNASGKPDNLDDFHVSDYIPVNAAYITQCEWERPEFQYTLTIAGKHGWIFGIPLQNRCSIGYLYNKDISSEDEVREDVQQIFEKYNLKPTNKTSSLSFNNYYRKNNFEDNIVHNGNASFFLEPLEATSIGTMDFIHRSALDLWRGAINSNEANNSFHSLMNETEFMIMLHYAAGSVFKTSFWEYAQERGIKKIESMAGDKKLSSIYQELREVRDVRDVRFYSKKLPEYGQWWAGSYIENLNGLNLFDTMDKVFN